MHTPRTGSTAALAAVLPVRKEFKPLMSEGDRPTLFHDVLDLLI